MSIQFLLCTSVTKHPFSFNLVAFISDCVICTYLLLFPGNWLSTFSVSPSSTICCFILDWLIIGFQDKKGLALFYYYLPLCSTNKNHLEYHCHCLWKVLYQWYLQLLMPCSCPLEVSSLLSQLELFVLFCCFGRDSWREWMNISLVSQLWIFCLRWPCYESMFIIKSIFDLSMSKVHTYFGK